MDFDNSKYQIFPYAHFEIAIIPFWIVGKQNANVQYCKWVISCKFGWELSVSM
jgi:hypothetical protein